MVPTLSPKMAGLGTLQQNPCRLPGFMGPVPSAALDKMVRFVLNLNDCLTQSQPILPSFLIGFIPLWLQTLYMSILKRLIFQAATQHPIHPDMS
jgi:hypothetical protein